MKHLLLLLPLLLMACNTTAPNEETKPTKNTITYYWDAINPELQVKLENTDYYTINLHIWDFEGEGYSIIKLAPYLALNCINTDSDYSILFIDRYCIEQDYSHYADILELEINTFTEVK